MKKINRLIKKSVSISLSVVSALSVYSVLPSSVFAADNVAYYINSSGKKTNYTSAATAWEKAVENNGTFGLLQDWDGGRRVVSEGHSVIVELNGHVLTRRKASWSSDGEVIFVDNNASLTVYGGTKSSPSANSSTSHSEQAYVKKTGDFERKSVTFKGGLIHGGNSSNGAGGIHMKENAKVKLYYTTVAGNRAEQTYNADGYGGGIMMDGENGYIYMKNSTVSYNFAYNDGGGIFVHKDAQRCSIKMVNSHVDNNVCIDNGAGISVDAAHFRLIGDASQALHPEYISDWNASGMGSSVSKNYITDSDNSGGGGGIYLNNDYASVEGINFISNNAYNGGNGGGVYISKANVSVKNCNLILNRADTLGGGIMNCKSNNTIENCTIYNNTGADPGGAGGGVYTKNTSNIALSGKTIIRGNHSTDYDKDNLYLPALAGTESTAFIVPKLKKGAEVNIRLSSQHMSRVSTFGAFRDDFYGYDNSSNKHIEWSGSDRALIILSGSKPVQTVSTLTPDSGKRTKSVSGGYTVDGTTYPLLKGVAELPSCSDSEEDVESVFYYSDGYFMGSTAKYNEHLATLSMNLAGASGYSNTVDTDEQVYLDKSKNFRQFMSDIGCKDEDIYVNNFNTEKPSTDTIGVGIASKKLADNSTLVIIGVRGMGYEAEWVSNMTLGTSGEAAGFSSAATQVFSELRGYLDRKGINGSSNNTKFWIAGYSRAGATSNLTAKRIVDAFDNNGARTYAYPVEAPKGGIASAKVSGNNYNCIHNIINQNDIVPWVGTTEMGFIRYGVDHYVPGSVTTSASNTAWDVCSSNYKTQKAKMIAQLKALNSEVPFDDYFHPATINYISGAVLSSFGFKMIAETDDETWTTEEFIDFFFEKLQEYALFYGNSPRSTYAGTEAAAGKTFEQSASVVASLLFGKPQDELDGLMACFMDLPERISKTDLAKMYLAIRNNDLSVGASWWTDTRDVLWEKLTTLSNDDRACGYHVISEYLTASEVSELENCFDALMVPVINLICMDYKNHDQNILGTLVYNISSIISNHYPEITCAWLRSYDSFYNNDTNKMTLADSVKKAPSEVAALITAPNGTERLITSNSEVITVGVFDKLSLIPSVATDRNTGEAIYYSFTTGNNSIVNSRAFSDPFTLGDMLLNYSSGGLFRIQAQAARNGSLLQEKEFRFRLGPIGDLDGSGETGINDATVLQKRIAKSISFTNGQLSLADVNKDDCINIRDVTAIQRFAAGIISLS